ncbi:MAG: glycosyltransferase family 4 protein [Spirochaetaceae bacterium]|nr:glycosyltransferase family 4 protein [Spirochaetaceae bacterium]
MKVLMLGWELPPVISGGLGTACKGIADSLAKNNIDLIFVIPTGRGGESALDSRIRVICADKYTPIEKYLKNFNEKYSEEFKSINFSDFSPYHTSYEGLSHETVEQNIIEKISSQKEYSILNFEGNYGRNLFEEVMKYRYIGKALGENESFEVIHAHDWMTYPAAICAKEASGKPLVVHVHSTEYDRSWSNPSKGIIDIEREGFDKADKIIAVSYYTKNIIVSEYGINPDKIDVVYNAVNKNTQFLRYQIRKSFDDKIVLFLGRITQQKGPEYFLEAAVKILNRMDNVRFVMSGSGDMFPKIVSKMAEYDIADKFHFTGFLSDTMVEKIFAMSDIYVMPSVSEPFGISPFEALLYDIPIVISKQSGASEILGNAPKVDFDNTDELAAVIINLLEDDMLREAVVSQCKEDMQNISWANSAARIIEIYNRLAII